MSLQAPPTAAHSQSYADFSFDSPQHTCEKVTDALGRRYDAYLVGPPIREGTSNVCWARFCCQNAFSSTFSLRRPLIQTGHVVSALCLPEPWHVCGAWLPCFNCFSGLSPGSWSAHMVLEEPRGAVRACEMF